MNFADLTVNSFARTVILVDLTMDLAALTVDLAPGTLNSADLTVNSVARTVDLAQWATSYFYKWRRVFKSRRHLYTDNGEFGCADSEFG